MRLHSVPLAWPSCSHIYSRLPRAVSLDWLCALHASLGSAHMCIAPTLIRARADPRPVAIPTCTPNHRCSRANRSCLSRLASPRPFPLSCLCVVSALVPPVLVRCARVARPLARTHPCPCTCRLHSRATSLLNVSLAWLVYPSRSTPARTAPSACSRTVPPATTLGLFASLPSHAHCILSSLV
jgi:hypothetical protein